MRIRILLTAGFICEPAHARPPMSCISLVVTARTFRALTNLLYVACSYLLWLSFRPAKVLCHSVWSSRTTHTARRDSKTVRYDEYSMGGAFDSPAPNTTHGLLVVVFFLLSYKFWTCCQRRTSDFDEFLRQEGCTAGDHKWIEVCQPSFPVLPEVYTS